MKYVGFNVGERVLIKRKDIYHLRDRLKRGNVYGKITEMSGYCVMVRPSWCKWEIELYLNEIGKVRAKRKKVITKNTNNNI